LLTTFGISKAYQTLIVQYILVEAVTYYNTLIGHQTLNQLIVIVSMLYMTMKFPTEDGTIIMVKVDPK